MQERIAHFSDAFRPKIDGVSISLENLLGEFDRRKISYDLYAPKTPGDYVDGLGIKRFGSLPLIFQPELRISIPLDRKNLSYLLKTRYGLIHSHSPGPLGLLAVQYARLREIPHFHTFHTYFAEYTHYLLNGKVINKETAGRLSAFWANRMDYLITPSAKIKDWLEKYGVSREVMVIANGIDLTRFIARTARDNYLIERNLVSPDDFVVMVAGRLGKEKAIDQLIEGLATFKRAYSGPRVVKLVVVGGGPERVALEVLAEKMQISDAVVFSGYVETAMMPRVYRSVDAFSLLSRSETQGMVVVEALASGLPVILANDSAYDGTLVAGDNGFYVEDQTGFIKALTTLVENPNLAWEMGRKGILLSQNFELARTTQKLIEYYQYGLEKWIDRKGIRKQIRTTTKEFRENLNKAWKSLERSIGPYV